MIAIDFHLQMSILIIQNMWARSYRVLSCTSYMAWSLLHKKIILVVNGGYLIAKCTKIATKNSHIRIPMIYFCIFLPWIVMDELQYMIAMSEISSRVTFPSISLRIAILYYSFLLYHVLTCVHNTLILSIQSRVIFDLWGIYIILRRRRRRRRRPTTNPLVANPTISTKSPPPTISKNLNQLLQLKPYRNSRSYSIIVLTPTMRYKGTPKRWQITLANGSPTQTYT